MRVVIPSEALLLGGAEGSSVHKLETKWQTLPGSATWSDAKTVRFMWESQRTLGKRVKEHNWGVGAKFTSKRRPVELIWWQEFPDQKAARSRERELKGWRREKKLKLLLNFGDRVYPSAAKAAASG